jgi:hypothetical protein
MVKFVLPRGLARVRAGEILPGANHVAPAEQGRTQGARAVSLKF